MKYKTVCYVWVRDKLYLSIGCNDQFVSLRDKSISSSFPSAYYVARWEEVDRIIVREEPIK